jgi:hypothetical protein
MSIKRLDQGRDRACSLVGKFKKSRLRGCFLWLGQLPEHFGVPRR